VSARVEEMLRLVKIPSPERRMHDYPHQMSGGMRQRIVGAIALACRPELLIADEPTSALDVSVQLEVLAILDALVRERGMGLIFISHDLRLVSSFCDRVLVMYAGRVVEQLDSGRLHEAQHPYTQGLLNCLPQLNAPRHPLPTLDRRPEWSA
jgi:peptide/nickel transport system ATP-binding protein